MKRFSLLGMAALACLGFGVADRAQAQFGPYNPPISPYINIIRGGSSPAVNYFNIVQPQMEFNNAIGSLAGQQNAGTQGGGTGTAVPTGHPIAFGNFSPYYNPRGALAYYGGGFGGGGMGGGMGGMGGGMGGMGGGMGGMGGGMGGMGGGMGGMGGGMGGMGGGMGGMGGGMGGMGGGMGGMGGGMGGMGR
jgi:hypothetical protein